MACASGDNQTFSLAGDTNALFASIALKKPLLTDWHDHLGYVSKDTLLRYGKYAFKDLDIDLTDKLESENQSSLPCKLYIFGKHHHSPFLSRQRWRENPLELVHSDLYESNVTSHGGGKHVLTFTDDTTNHGMIYVLPNKSASTILKAFKEYQA